MAVLPDQTMTLLADGAHDGTVVVASNSLVVIGSYATLQSKRAGAKSFKVIAVSGSGNVQLGDTKSGTPLSVTQWLVADGASMVVVGGSVSPLPPAQFDAIKLNAASGETAITLVSGAVIDFGGGCHLSFGGGFLVPDQPLYTPYYVATAPGSSFWASVAGCKFLMANNSFLVDSEQSALLMGNAAALVDVAVILDNVTAQTSGKILSVRTHGVEQLAVDFQGKLITQSAGANPVSGQATMSGGTIDVATTAVKSTSKVLLTRVSGTVGHIGTWSITITDGVKFTVASSNVLDDSVFNWFIFE